MSASIDWSNLNGGEQEDALSWLRDAWSLVQQDARQSGNAQAYAYAQQQGAIAQNLSTDSSAADVQSSVSAYDGLYNAALRNPAFARFIHASTPIDVNVASVTVPGSNPPTAEPSEENWANVIDLAHRLLPAGDSLRGAIERWNEWFRTMSSGVLGARSDIYRYLRARRLLAWAQNQLLDFQRNHTAAADPPAPNPRTQTQRPSSGGFPGWLLLLVPFLFGKGRR